MPKINAMNITLNPKSVLASGVRKIIKIQNKNDKEIPLNILKAISLIIIAEFHNVDKLDFQVE